MSSGQVKVSGPVGCQMVFFPKVQVGTNLKFTSSDSMERRDDKTDAAFDNFDVAISSFNNTELGDFDTMLGSLGFSLGDAAGSFPVRIGNDPKQLHALEDFVCCVLLISCALCIQAHARR